MGPVAGCASSGSCTAQQAAGERSAERRSGRVVHHAGARAVHQPPLLIPCWRTLASRVLLSSVAIVIGPTPPGTGVIQAARAAAAANSTSPTSLLSAVR